MDQRGTVKIELNKRKMKFRSLESKKKGGKMEQDIDKIKQEINELAKKYDLRFIVFKTTDVKYIDGKINCVNVEAELIY